MNQEDRDQIVAKLQKLIETQESLLRKNPKPKIKDSLLIRKLVFSKLADIFESLRAE